MQHQVPAQEVSFPKPATPEPGSLQEIAPGILWLRLPLPFLLNHVNIYLIEDEGGWATLDTGLGTDMCKAAWDAAFAGPLRGKRLTRVICSHFHPDHMGLVGWLTERFGCPLSVTRTEFLTAKVLENSTFAANPHFYTERGMPTDFGATVAQDGHEYLRLVTGVPTHFDRLAAGRRITVGGRDFRIFTGGGHSPEQAMLYCASDKVFVSFDQVMTKISPNVSVYAMEPDANPLGEYLTSLEELRAEIAPDVLVLPGHHLPFKGLHTRIAELQQHHATRCALIADAARQAPQSAADLVPVLFKRQMDAHQTGFAFGETVAHVNFMLARGDLVESRDPDGILRVRKPAS
jgi:glyoxylase-like metal-dependent hydrolase (beta-lactamase superfamily II)